MQQLDYMMLSIVVLLLALVFVAQGLAANLPCNSNLRVVLPNLFKHCREPGDHCYYTGSEWSSWEFIGTYKAKNCTTKRAFKEVRTRADYHKVCKNETETRYTCKCVYILIIYSSICDCIYIDNNYNKVVCLLLWTLAIANVILPINLRSFCCIMRCSSICNLSDSLYVREGMSILLFTKTYKHV